MAFEQQIRSETATNGAIFTVFSTASGVGKTLVAINLAAEIARQGFRACVVDLDLQFGDVCNALSIQPECTLADAHRMVEEHGEHADVQSCALDIQINGTVFSVLAAPNLLEEAYNVQTGKVRQILASLRRSFDYVIIDTTAAFSELNIMCIEVSTIVSFVGIVDFLPTIKNMRIGYETLKNIGFDTGKIRFILNRSDAKTNLSLGDVEALLGEKFTIVLPNDFRTAKNSILQGEPIVLSTQDSRLRSALRALAMNHTGQQNMQDDKGKKSKGGSWLKRLFGR